MNPTNRLSAFLLLVFLTMSGILVSTQSALSEDVISPAIHRVAWPDGTQATEPIVIMKATTHIIRFDRRIARVAISNPAVCDITTAGDTDILINAKKAGSANLIVWDADNNMATYHIDSVLDADRLLLVLKSVDPESKLQIVPFNETLAVYGTTETNLKLIQIREAAKTFEEHTLVYVKIREPKQVLLEVRFAEVKRQFGKDFKVDLDSFPGFFAFSSFTGKTGASSSTSDEGGTFTSQQNGASYQLFPRGTENVGNLFLDYFSDSFAVNNYIRWLEDKNILKVIARPNLVAKDGEEAEFIAGGEFPVPTVSNNSVQINYREFGTALKFTPEILDNEVIRLKLEASVSELDFTNTVTSGGTTVPTLLKRSHKSTAEMKENQTLVISGLISQKINKIQRKVPILGDIPILQTIFKSESSSRTDVELLVIVTPHLVKPLNLNENKEFYNEQYVKQAAKLFKPDFADVQGDAINKMIRQDEKLYNLKNEEPQPRRRKLNSTTERSAFTKESAAPSPSYDDKNPFFNPSVLNQPTAAHSEQTAQPISITPGNGNKGYIGGPIANGAV